MTNKLTTVIKNISYSITANALSLVTSIFMVLFVAKQFGVNEYGYWQLYLFYVSYAGFFTFGWVDGIYLRYGGKQYEDLNKTVFISQFWIMLLFEIVIAIGMILWSYTLPDIEKIYIFITFAINIIILSVRGIYVYVLEATNHIKEFAYLTFIEKLVFLILTIIILFFHFTDYHYLVIADLIGKTLSFIYTVYICRDLVFGKMASLQISLKEIWNNISVGSKLLIANIASMLIIGIVRYLIEMFWSIEVFSKVSLSLNISNMLIVFINAVGIVLFPMLKRIDYNKLSYLYSQLSTGLMVLLFVMLLTYYPAKIVLSTWLPQYAESLKYLSLLFPICIFESKMSLLCNTYLKALRKENILLVLNIVSVGISCICSIFTIIIFRNIELAILTITIVLGIRCYLSDIYIAYYFKHKIAKEIIIEVILISIFIISSWFIDNAFSTVIYFFALCLYLFYKKDSIIDIIQKINNVN